MSEEELTRRVRFYRKGRMTNESIAHQIVVDYYRLTGKKIDHAERDVLKLVQEVK